jgi:cyclopropane-fatty-acyl-phospholipid synthase
MSLIANTANHLAESGLVPDALIRNGIRKLVSERKREISVQNGADIAAFVERMNQAPIALVPELANEQHYEVPAAFFEAVLGAHRKYSCCYWGENTLNLDEAEQLSLEINCQGS